MMIFSPALIIVVFFVGVLIGGVGIGGVLLVPSLKYLGGIPLHIAIPACMAAYVMTGLVGATIFARQGSINWPLALKVCLGALPGAYIGAWLLPKISPTVLEVFIAVLLLSSGINALVSSKESHEKKPKSLFLLITGLITGMGSALTGTGGPLLLIPILVWRRVSVLTAIGLAQAIQIPISLMATAGNIMHSTVDIKLSLFLMIIIACGAVIGAKTVHRIAIDTVKKSVACFLVIIGLALLLNIIGNMVFPG